MARLVARTLQLCFTVLLVVHASQQDLLCRTWPETRFPSWPSKGFEGQADPLDLELLRRRAWYNRGDMTRLDAFLRRLASAASDASKNSDPINVVVFGGSFTLGNELEHKQRSSWPERFVAWLRRAYPGAAHLIKLKNIAMGATDSFYGGKHQTKWLLERARSGWVADLAIVDFGVNDGVSATDASIIRGTASIVYRILNSAALSPRRANASKPALVYVEGAGLGRDNNHQDCMGRHPGSFYLPRTTGACTHYYSPQDVHSIVTLPVGVPTVSYRDAASWRDPLRAIGAELNATIRATLNPLWAGSKHPAEVTHELFAAVLAFAIQQRANELCEEKEEHFQQPLEGTSLAACTFLKQPSLSLPEPVTRQPWFSRGDGLWANLLDGALRRSALDRRPLRVGIITGNLGAGIHGRSSVNSPWPVQMRAKEENVEILYLAKAEGGRGGGCKIVLQETPHAFASSIDVAALLDEDRGCTSWRQQIDLVVVSLSDADATAMLPPSLVINGTQRIISALSEHSAPIDARRFHNRGRATTAMIFFETPYRASDVTEASKHARGSNGTVLQDDHLVATPYFDVHAWHAFFAVRAGLPFVSFSRAVWPIISQVPKREWTLGRDQPYSAHSIVADYLLYALKARLQESLGGCNRVEGSVTGVLALIPYLKPRIEDHSSVYPMNKDRHSRTKDHEVGGGDCGNDVLSWLPAVGSNGGVTGALARAAVVTGAQSDWRFYEDRIAKPGWIFEGDPNSKSTLEINVNVSGILPTINMGYLKSYTCMGRMRVWLESKTSSSTDSTSSSRGTEVSGYWEQRVSVGQNFHFVGDRSDGNGNQAGEHVPMLLKLQPLPSSDNPECSGSKVKFKVTYVESCG